VVRKRGRSILVLAVVAVALAACSSDKKPAASSQSSGLLSSPAATAAASASGTGTESSATGPTVTQWPLTTSPPPSKPDPKSSSSSSKSSAPGTGPSTAVCNRLSGAQLQQALGVSFSSARGDNSTCTFGGDDGSSIQLSVTPIAGDTQEELQRSEGRCDPGTVHTINRGDGAYTCRASGSPVGGIATQGKLLRIVAFDLGSISPEKGESGFAQLVGDLA
jgi:hypothetical protein